MMFRTSYTEEVNRTEPEVIVATSIERKLNFLIAVSPRSVVAHLLEASEVGRT